MPQLFSQVVKADALGTSVDSLESIGTITLNDKAKRVHALITQTVSTGVNTAAEANLGEIIFNYSRGNITDFKFDAGIKHGGAPATNIAPATPKHQIIPLDIPANLNDDLSFQYNAQLPEPTQEVASQIFVVYSDGGVPQNVIKALWEGKLFTPPRESQVANDSEIGDLTTEIMNDTIVIEGQFNQIQGYKAVISPDADETAGEHFLAHVEFSADVGEINPNHQQWPLPAIGAGLGSKVGLPVITEDVLLPLFWDKSQKKGTFTQTIKLQAVTSGANAVSLTMFAG